MKSGHSVLSVYMSFLQLFLVLLGLNQWETGFGPTHLLSNSAHLVVAMHFSFLSNNHNIMNMHLLLLI